MKENKETLSDSRRNIAAGAGIGVILGGAVADLLSPSSLVGILGMIAGAAAGAAIASRYFPKVYLMEYSKETSRHLILSGVFFIFVLLASLAIQDENHSQAMQILLAIVPGIAGLMFMVAIGNTISKLDDLQRKIQVEAMAIAFGLTILITMTVGLLAQVGLPQANWLLVSLIMVLSWGAAKIWIGWKYR